jgi:ABC-2 type transport system permease protein
MILSLFAGVYFPISTLPPFLHAFAKIIPASYVFESMRSILTAGTFPGDLVANLFIGALIAFVYLVGASRVFIYIYRKNLESGTIARFNAEAL